MKFSSFLFISILLHAVTLVASAEEDGEANLVKRARTKERHKERLADHWFASHPSQDGESEDPPSTYSSSGESEEWMLEHPSSTDSPSSESAEEWKPEDAPSTYSSSADFEDWKSQGSFSSSHSSDNHLDLRQSLQHHEHASLSARTRSSLSRAATTPDALKSKVESSFKPATYNTRRHGASSSSALVHSSGSKKQIDASSSQEQTSPHGHRKTGRMSRMDDSDVLEESDTSKGSSQADKKDQEHQAEKGHHDLIVRPGLASKKKRKFSSISALVSTKPSLHRASQHDHTSRGDPGTRWEHEKALLDHTSCNGETSIGTNQEKAHTLNSNLSGLARDPAIPRRPKSGWKRPRERLEYEDPASPNETTGSSTDSPNVHPPKKKKKANSELQREKSRFDKEMEKHTSKVVSDFQKKFHQGPSTQDQQKQLTRAIFNALRDAKQRAVDNDESQSGNSFYKLRGVDKALIDMKVYARLVKAQYKKESRHRHPESTILSGRQYDNKRHGPTKKQVAEGHTATPEQIRRRQDFSDYRNLRVRLHKRISGEKEGRKEGRKRRSLRPWTQKDTNEVFRFARENERLSGILDLFKEARHLLPPEHWHEKKSEASSFEGGEREERIAGKSEKGKRIATPS